jgi:hypothetical protein
MKKPSIFIYLLYLLSFTASAELNDLDKLHAEAVIKNCDDLFQQVIMSRERLFNRAPHIKKRDFYSSKTQRKEYKATIKLYNSYFTAFDNALIELNSVRKNSNLIRQAMTPKELQDLVEPYSSNCIRFSAGIIGFVDWVFGSKAPEYDIIYQEWLINNI